MEPVSFVVGAAGLVGTFTACVDCFNYVRLGLDFETSIIKLDIIRLRFTRWGEVVGIGQSDESTAVGQLMSNLRTPERDYQIVIRTLGQILRLFEASEEASRRLAIKIPKDQSVVTEDIIIENKNIRDLHKKMQDLVIQRQKRSSIAQKISWAICKKNDMEKLIENLNDLVTALVELAPPKPQQELCNTELARMNSDHDLVLLDNVLQEPIDEEGTKLDDALHECVAGAIEQRKGVMNTTSWKRSTVGDGSSIQQGDMVSDTYQGGVPDQARDYIVEDSKFGKNVFFHQGSTFGGRN